MSFAGILVRASQSLEVLKIEDSSNLIGPHLAELILPGKLQQLRCLEVDTAWLNEPDIIFLLEDKSRSLRNVVFRRVFVAEDVNWSMVLRTLRSSTRLPALESFLLGYCGRVRQEVWAQDYLRRRNDCEPMAEARRLLLELSEEL